MSDGGGSAAGGSDATPALRLEGVDGYYGDSHVLHGVGFTLRPGRLLALLGRNGAGKTTTLSTVMGFIRPRRGAITLFGEPVAGRSPEAVSRAGIALVPQGRRVFRSLSVRENLVVAAQRRARGAPASGVADGWTLERVYGLFPRLRERHAQAAGTLSGGEQQMLAIGRALMGNPRVLLLDEPSEGLAPQIVAEVGRIIARLAGDGLSIVLVEQNVKLTLDLADDVVIINTGSVVFEGTADAMRADEANLSRHLGVF